MLKSFIKNSLIAGICLTLVLSGCSRGTLHIDKAKTRVYSSVQSNSSINKPLIIEWPSSDRGALESKMKKGTVAVRISNGEIELLEDCNPGGEYKYTGFTKKIETQVLTTDSELDANFSLGSAKLGGELKKFGKLFINLSLVGQLESNFDNTQILPDTPTCQRATHIVKSASIGAFRFYAGEGKTLGAIATTGKTANQFGIDANAGRGKRSEFLSEDGDFDQCELSNPDDKTPPKGCSALLRLRLIDLGASKSTQTVPQYEFGTLEFIYSDQLDFQMESEKELSPWIHGPLPYELCSSLKNITKKSPFDSLYNYCDMIESCVTASPPYKNNFKWTLKIQPDNNPFKNTYNNFEKIIKSAARLKTDDKKLIERLASNIVALLLWHESQLKKDNPDVANIIKLLTPLLEVAPKDSIKSDDEWWAAHILTVAGLQDFSLQLSQTMPINFASMWHLYEASLQNMEKTLNIIPGIIEKFDNCDEKKFQAMNIYNIMLENTKSTDTLLKALIDLEKAFEQQGEWDYPGTRINDLARFSGLSTETEHYLEDSPWVLSDFLYSKAQNCFFHENYACVRQTFKKILQHPEFPAYPLAYNGMIELESAIGDRSVAFKMKMNEPDWANDPFWGDHLKSVPACPVTDEKISAVKNNVLKFMNNDNSMSRDKYELTGRDLPEWTILINAGSALRECHYAEERTSEGLIIINRQKENGVVEVSSSSNLNEVDKCIKNNLFNKWKDTKFGLKLTIKIIDNLPWYTDPSNGWSKLERYRLVCEAGQIEGCFKWGVLLSSDPHQETGNINAARKIIHDACKKGHRQACTKDKNWIEKTTGKN